MAVSIVDNFQIQKYFSIVKIKDYLKALELSVRSAKYTFQNYLEIKSIKEGGHGRPPHSRKIKGSFGKSKNGGNMRRAKQKRKRIEARLPK